LLIIAKSRGILRLPAGRQGLRPQDDAGKIVILSETLPAGRQALLRRAGKNPTQCKRSFINN